MDLPVVNRNSYEVNISSPFVINDYDIMYSDHLVCILKPNVKKGVIIWSQYTQPNDTESLTEIGLKTGKQLHMEGIEFGRIIYHPYIFFRAPYKSPIINYSSVKSEAISLYGEGHIDNRKKKWIRVDPDRTYVFSSEIRAKYGPTFLYGSNEYKSALHKELNKSKKTLTTYFKIINNNKNISSINDKYNQVKYNLYTSKKKQFPNKYTLSYPWDNNLIDTNSEILVSIPHLTPEYFIDIHN
jgi:hypothetical protein